jgi:mitogen-activated protein kinase kinase
MANLILSRSLDEISTLFGPVRIDVLGKISQAVLSGLIYLDTYHGIMHRNLKPSHVLVNARGQVKLCDFGASTTLSDIREAETMCGSRLYHSPERCQGSLYTMKSEVWSFGVTVMELAIGEYPIVPEDGNDERYGMNSLALAHAIIFRPSPTLPESDAFPKVLHEMINKCLAKSPEERPTIQELYVQHYFECVWL